jgi:hypothetical protein
MIAESTSAISRSSSSSSNNIRSNSSSSSGAQGASADDGRITFEEFKQVALKGSKLNTSKLWESVRNAPVKVPTESVDVVAASASLVKSNESAVVPASFVVVPQPFLSVSVVKLPQLQPFGNEYATLRVYRPMAVPTNITQATPMESLQSKIHDDRVLAYKSAAAGTTLLAICAAYRRFVKHL